jgi:hypothetical protein
MVNPGQLHAARRARHGEGSLHGTCVPSMRARLWGSVKPRMSGAELKTLI